MKRFLAGWCKKHCAHRIAPRAGFGRPSPLRKHSCFLGPRTPNPTPIHVTLHRKPFFTSLLVIAALLAVAAPASAQPKGPRDVITGARKQREARELRQAVEKADPGTEPEPASESEPESESGTEPGSESATGAGTESESATESESGTDSDSDSAPDPHASPHGGADPHAAAAGAPAAPPPLSQSQPNRSLPAGTVRVRVVDPQERPVAGADVRLGIMAADGTRSAEQEKTGPDGIATFSDLKVGDRQAYRVSVPYEGASYGANPFRLPPRGGFDVTIRRLPVTHDDRMILLYVGATSIELKDERIKVVQQARLLNIGRETYVFPGEGTLVGLPEGFMAVQSQDSMTDQKIAEAPGGIRVTGSLPPGEATLLWGFDLPLEDTEADFTVELPWRTFAYRVLADAPPGLQMQVAGMPDPMLHEDAGRRFLVTEIQRKVGEEPFRTLTVHLAGIPGPGPARWIAAALALLAVAGGFVLSRRDPAPARAQNAIEDLAAHKQRILEDARELQRLREQDEAGPEYYAEQRARLEEELSAVLLTESRLEAGPRKKKQSK